MAMQTAAGGRAAPSPRDPRPYLPAVLGGLIALKIALLFALAVHGRFVMDEFAQLGWAKYLGHGLFDTIWPAKAVGYAIFYKLAHLIGWNAVSILVAGRVETALLGCATIALTYSCARALGQDRVRALAIVLVLLCFSNFLERIYRTIAEPVALFFAVAALALVLRGSADRPMRLVAAGVLSGLSFLCTQKALYFDVALGIALVGDAALRRQCGGAVARGAWLVAGWVLPIIAYCFVFGGAHPGAVAENVFIGPTIIAGRGGADYGGLRHYVLASLQQNALIYLFCLAGMALRLRHLRQLGEQERIALIFTIVITLLVYSHDQPWPYVFIMAQPFMALWAIAPIDHLARNPRFSRIAVIVLAVGIAFSFARSIVYLRLGNTTQLALVARAESLLGPDDIYFDGIAMLPNRREPSTLWIDRHYILMTLREGRASEAYQLLAHSSPKLILWSYRMDAIEPVVGPLIRNDYVQVAPNIRMVGRELKRSTAARFNVRIPGAYALYNRAGQPVGGTIAVNGHASTAPIRMPRGSYDITLLSGPESALLLPLGDYAGKLATGRDDAQLFAHIYD
ncbi:hypothetical protein ACUXST_001113 [Sphingomonas sp. F9_3S_D5_B_2]